MKASQWIKILNSRTGINMILGGPLTFNVDGRKYTIKNVSDIDSVVEQIRKDDLRMYVLVDSSLAYIHKAVQGSHAVAAYLLKYPTTQWKNGTIVYLDVDLATLRSYVNDKNIKTQNNQTFNEIAPFYEPDWAASPILTAIACVGGMGVFPEYKSVKMPKGIFSWFFK